MRVWGPEVGSQGVKNASVGVGGGGRKRLSMSTGSQPRRGQNGSRGRRQGEQDTHAHLGMRRNVRTMSEILYGLKGFWRREKQGNRDMVMRGAEHGEIHIQKGNHARYYTNLFEMLERREREREKGEMFERRER